MSKNPYLNALCAEAYIVLVVLIIQFLSRPNTPDTILDGMLALSLFVLSAAIMGYIFLGKPVQMYLDGAKEQAVSLFARTVGSFAVITFVAFVIVKIWR